MLVFLIIRYIRNIKKRVYYTIVYLVLVSISFYITINLTEFKKFTSFMQNFNYTFKELCTANKFLYISTGYCKADVKKM